MFAMRLALSVGRLDWQKAVDEIGLENFAKWIAYDRIEPIGLWHPASMVASVGANELRMVAAGFGGNKLRPEDMYAQNDFVPGVAEKKKELETEKTCEALEGLIGL